jgi:lipoyl-dependent peroxiredoxin
VSFPARFEAVTEGQTSPEELIAAAHASCFSMALANGLAQAGNAPDRLETSVTITLDRVDGAPTITTAEIKVRGTVPGITQEQFLEAAQTAEQNCPVSKALKGSVQLSLDAALT